MAIDTSTHNMDRINSLPTLQIDIINNNSDDPELDVDYFKEEDKTEIKESDIDIDSLEKETQEIKPTILIIQKALYMTLIKILLVILMSWVKLISINPISQSWFLYALSILQVIN